MSAPESTPERAAPYRLYGAERLLYIETPAVNFRPLSCCRLGPERVSTAVAARGGFGDDVGVPV